MENTKSIDEMTFEQALSELENIVKRLDSGQELLEDSIKSFERAAMLKKHCEKKLNEAKLKIDNIKDIQQNQE